MGRPLVAIIDYGMGNLLSVKNALEKQGAKVEFVSKPAGLEKSAFDAVVLPGVGAFPNGMRNLKPFIPALEKKVFQDRLPFLGICLGMQMLFAQGTEFGRTPGLGWLKGTVSKLPASGLTLPHMGWNTLQIRPNPLLRGVKNGDYAYFVHSYYAKPGRETVATTNYGTAISAAVAKDNVFGTQFHPEKSGETGLRIIRNFLELSR